MEKVKKFFASLEEIYEANYRLIYVYICDYSVDEELVEEISSIVWEKVAEHSEDYLAKDDRWLKNSLRIIVRTTMADHFRREAAFNRAYEKLKEATERYGEDCSEEIFREDRKRYLAKALCVLSEEGKTADKYEVRPPAYIKGSGRAPGHIRRGRQDETGADTPQTEGRDREIGK